MSADLGPWELSEIEQRNLLTVFVQQRRLQGRRVLLVVDDVHAFNAAALEELARLLSFKIDQRPALEIVLAGLPLQESALAALRVALDQAELAQHVLPAPSPHDLVSYIDWRLARFGASQQISPMASQMIARLTGGRFAAADVLCQMSLLVTRQLKLERVDARVVRQAIATLVTRQTAKLDETGALPSEPQSPIPPSGQLIISRGGKVVTRVTLGARRKTLIGRSEDNDICLKNPYLSRHHAAIVGTAEGYYIVDLNSVNGVQLNGRPIDRAALCDEDVLTLGPFRLKVQMPEWLAQRGPPPEAEPLDDTAVMSTPAEPPTSSTMRRVK